MPLKSYGVLKGKAIEVRLGAGSSPHYQVRLIDDTTDYRIAINVKSQVAPSEVEYLIVEAFQHPILETIAPLPLGYTPLAPTPTSGALDFIRGNLFDRTLMRPLPANVPGFDNDLNEKIDGVMQRAVADEAAVVYAFGERWGPEKDKKDKYFGFLPGNGIHDIHMNQGNVGQFKSDDGVYQDGGVFINFPDQGEWIAVFLRFQSQAWHTDDTTGHALSEPTDDDLPTSDEPHGLVRIVAALVNAVTSPEVNTVTLLNTAPHSVSLAGWALLDTQKKRLDLTGELAAGAIRVVNVADPFALSNKGGTITIVDENGLKVDGVSYTKEQAKNPGWTIVFRAAYGEVGAGGLVSRARAARSAQAARRGRL
jgi:uncharacterized protein YukJ